jgi:hypothetical protein
MALEVATEQHRAKNREYSRKYSAKTRAQINDKARACRAKNPEKVREYNREYDAKNRDRINGQERARRAKNSEQINERAREYHAANREQINERKREYDAANSSAKCEKTRNRVHNLAPGQYDDMLAAQSGLCAICGKPETALSSSGGVRALAVDHCHDTGVRGGLLCHRCNAGIGLLNDDPALFRAAIDYLESVRPRLRIA